MKVRNFTIDDISDICRLINSELGYDVSYEELKTRILQMLEEKNYTIFIAEENKKVIGFIGLQMCLVFEITGKVMRIIALAVASDFQGLGVGRALIKEAEKYANENGVSVIAVNSGIKRKEAHCFYEKNLFYKKGYSFFKNIK